MKGTSCGASSCDVVKKTQVIIENIIWIQGNTGKERQIKTREPDLEEKMIMVADDVPLRHKTQSCIQPQPITRP